MVKTARIGPTATGDIEGRAVVYRCPDKGQAERDVDRVAETGVLEYRQTLVVIHGDDHVTGLQGGGGEGRIRRHRATDIHAAGAAFLDGWCDQLFVLPAEVPTFAGVRIQA